ncbi:hypothetical protein BH24ACT9_BH24ACT9_01110 [soil metagenome]
MLAVHSAEPEHDGAGLQVQIFDSRFSQSGPSR